MNPIALFFIFPIITAIQALVEACFVMPATRVVAGFTPSYGLAYKTTFWAGIVGGGFFLLFGVAFVQPGRSIPTLLVLILASVSFLLQAWVYQANIADYEKGSITYGKACLLRLFVGLFSIAIVLALSLVIYAIDTL